MATLTIVDNSIQQGESLSFSFTGMQPEWYCFVGVVGGLSAQFYTEVNGSGSGTLGPINNVAGQYTLRVWDDMGRSATATFTVSATPVPGWVLVTAVTTIFSVARNEPVVNAWVPAISTIFSLIRNEPVINQWVPVISTIFSVARAEPVINNWVPVTEVTTVFSIERGSPLINGWVSVPSVTTLISLTRVGGGGGGGSETPSWVLPVAIIGGAALAGVAIAKGTKKKPTTTSKNTLART